MNIGFRPNPKAQVEMKFRELFGGDRRVTVSGVRVTPEDCRRRGLRCTTRDGLYVTEILVDGRPIARSTDRDWRRAYRLLAGEVERLYADGSLLGDA